MLIRNEFLLQFKCYPYILEKKPLVEDGIIRKEILFFLFHFFFVYSINNLVEHTLLASLTDGKFEDN